MVPCIIYAAEKKNVLILNSYHQGYKWTDDEVRGIVNGLFPEQDNIKTYIEYMGTKWNFSSDYLKELCILYKKKFNRVRFDVIISTDDDAFNFLQKYRDGVFGRVPVVFCGLNWITPGKLSGMKSVTGVNETTDISLNLYLMMKVHPQVKKIYAVIDSTTTGISVYNKLIEIMPQYEGKIDIIPLYDLEMKALMEQVSIMGNDSLVLLTVFSRDGTGQFFEYDEYSTMISKKSSVPVYGLWDFYLGHGILGGNLATGYSQGITAGNIALRVLKGENAESIPVVMDSPNTYMFDFLQMKRFGIGRDLIPAASIVINEPSSFYSVNKTVLIP
jgi:sigma-B regulation protein RsbU (phosphoserine phosphatase)